MARKKKPLPSLEALRPRLAGSRTVALGSFLGLVLVILIWGLLFTEDHGAPGWVPKAWVALKLLPLAIVLPGVLLGSARGHAWACYVVNLYFISGVLNAFEPGQRIYGWAEALLSALLFCSALLYTRWRFQYERKLAGED